MIGIDKCSSIFLWSQPLGQLKSGCCDVTIITIKVTFFTLPYSPDPFRGGSGAPLLTYALII